MASSLECKAVGVANSRTGALRNKMFGQSCYELEQAQEAVRYVEEPSPIWLSACIMCGGRPFGCVDEGRCSLMDSRPPVLGGACIRKTDD